jgi:flagellar hook protein FlgE
VRLESALYSSKSGIETHGQAIAVVGDNVANTNTTGYKASRAEFADIFVEGRDGRQSVAGPITGSGATLVAARPILTSGTLESTGREFDVAVDGKGFFYIGNPEAPTFTRAGNFEVSRDGILSTKDGNPVLGFAAPRTDSSALAPINLYSVGTAGKESSSLALFGNLDARASVTTVPPSPQTFGEIGTSASFVAEQGLYDSVGGRRSILLGFYKTSPNTWSVRAYIDGKDVGGTTGAPVEIGTVDNITFSPNGTLSPEAREAARMTLNPAYSGGTAAGNVALDLGGFQQFAAGSGINSLVTDGKSVGKIDGYDITDEGLIQARLDNGDTVSIASIPLAIVRNEDGLMRGGNTLYQVSDRTGAVVATTAGTGSAGKIKNFSLELSTVDISKEFVDLTLYQRGYQANSQTLNATSQLLRDTIQLMG